MIHKSKILNLARLTLTFTGSLVSTAVLSALGPDPVRAEKPNIKVGWLITQTGNGAPVGEDCRIGMELGKANFLNQSNVEFIVSDSRDTPSYSISEAKKMIAADQVVALVSHRSNIAMPLNPISRQAKVPLLGLSAHPEFTAQNSYAFRIWSLAGDEGAVLADVAWRAGKRRLATITLEDEYLIELTKGLKRRWRENGGEFELEESVDSSFNDWAGIATRLLAAKPDAIMVNVGLSQLAVLLRKLHELGNRAQVFTNYWASNRNVTEATPKSAMEGIIFPQPSTEFPAFMRAVHNSSDFEKIGQSPSPMIFNCYLAVATISQVLTSKPNLGTASEFQHELEQISNLRIDGLAIPVRNREVLGPISAMIIRNGIAEPLDR